MTDGNKQALMEYAMRALSRRPHSTHELKKKLKKRPHFEKGLDVAVIDRLIDLNYLNDDLYIRRHIEIARDARFEGLQKIAQKLRHKGFSFKEVKERWDELVLDEESLARQALKKIHLRLSRVPKEKRFDKTARYLAGRGFSPGICFKLAKLDQDL